MSTTFFFYIFFHEEFFKILCKNKVQFQFGLYSEIQKNNYAVVKLRSYAEFWSLWRDSNLRPAHYKNEQLYIVIFAKHY